MRILKANQRYEDLSVGAALGGHLDASILRGNDEDLPVNEFTRPARTPYSDPPPDTGHVMLALTRLEGKVDNLASLFRQLLGRLAEDDEGEPEDITLEGGPAGAERDTSQPL